MLTTLSLRFSSPFRAFRLSVLQGMNFLAGLLLCYLDREADAFAALVLLMHDRGLREMYRPDMRLLQVRAPCLRMCLRPCLCLRAHTRTHAWKSMRAGAASRAVAAQHTRALLRRQCLLRGRSHHSMLTCVGWPAQLLFAFQASPYGPLTGARRLPHRFAVLIKIFTFLNVFF
jgi:hypothetical protein